MCVYIYVLPIVIEGVSDDFYYFYSNLSWGTLLAAGVIIFAQIIHEAAEALTFSLTIIGNTGYVS